MHLSILVNELLLGLMGSVSGAVQTPDGPIVVGPCTKKRALNEVLSRRTLSWNSNRWPRLQP
jgi:hypothetical protein